MTNRQRLALVFALCGLMASAPNLLAQSEGSLRKLEQPLRRSHKPIGAGGDGDEALLANRLRASQDQLDHQVLQALAQKMKNDPSKFKLTPKRLEMIQRLLEDRKTQELLKDPAFTDLFRDALKNPNLTPEELDALRQTLDNIPPEKLAELAQKVSENPRDYNLTEQERRDFQKLAEGMQKGQPPLDPAKAAEILNKLRQNPNVQPGTIDTLQRAIPGLTQPEPTIPGSPGTPGTTVEPMNPVVPPASGNGENPTTPTPTPAAQTPPADDQAAETLLKIADWLATNDTDNKIVDSLVDLMRFVAKNDGDDSGVPLDTLAKWGSDWLHPNDWWPDEKVKTAGSWLEKLNPPTPPETAQLPSSPSLPNTPNVSSGSMTNITETTIRVLFWGALVVVVAFIGWRLVLYARDGLERRRQDGLANRWPLLPEQVATRGDLVRAFEFLALRCLGLDAKHRHHLDLAKRLGGATPENPSRRQAADHLAHLYELARYAPDDEPLPETELAAARRDLSFLAGAAGA